MKNLSIIIVCLAIGMVACNPKNNEKTVDGESEGKSFAESVCTPNSKYELIASYDFSGKLEDHFETHPDWKDNPSKGVINDASYYQRNDRFEFEVLSASMAASECWWKWKQNMPSNKSWKIKADLTVPEVWTSGEDPEYQIGVGLFVGKPEGYTVFEVDFSAIASGSRFVLSQNIQNRRGGDPNYVGMDVPKEKETVNLEIIYCNEDKSLSTYFDGIRVDTQPIDDKGIFNWQVGSVFHVGIMAFSEGACTSNFLYVDNWEVYELK